MLQVVVVVVFSSLSRNGNISTNNAQGVAGRQALLTMQKSAKLMAQKDVNNSYNCNNKETSK